MTKTFHSQPDEASRSAPIASPAVAIATCPLTSKVFWHCYTDREAKALLWRGGERRRLLKAGAHLYYLVSAEKKGSLYWEVSGRCPSGVLERNEFRLIQH